MTRGPTTGLSTLGEGREIKNLYLRGKSWYYEFWHDGQRYGPKSLGPISRREAVKRFRAIKLAVLEGRELPRTGPPVTLRAFVEEFLLW